jgi:hypothetical protein
MGFDQPALAGNVALHIRLPLWSAMVTNAWFRRPARLTFPRMGQPKDFNYFVEFKDG